ncbi:ESX secretion-associated protein EspG [Crossiella sp. SN42]|uniref:ESX secretion-associated protein EspG n=1 Tax=Crossiella sp. SN42 TaxID=2944808 RepID=UPI00207CF8F9|nr:ESX secretion-associated protein EspG [Crossiella sp. SN42]MCO1579699.1 ESX secretion-associated protein EspG [Crossiella sp. SN42]
MTGVLTTLTPVELDFAWQELGLERMPYPLRLRSHGVTMEERGVLRHQVLEGLRQRRLARERGPRWELDPLLEDQLGLLARHTVAVELIQYTEEPLHAVAVARGESAALAAQTEDGCLHLREVRDTGLAEAIVSVLPPGQAGRQAPVSAPLAGLQRATGPEKLDPFGDSVDQLVAAGMNRNEAYTLDYLSRHRHQGGQFSVSVAERYTTHMERDPSVISWFDSEDGRYLLVSERGRLSISAADNLRIAHRVQELISAVRTG